MTVHAFLNIRADPRNPGHLVNIPAAHVLIAVANLVISVALLTVLSGTIFKLLPDKQIEWRDVAIGALATAILFTIGKSAIGLYIGHSKIASGYGAAGALVVMLV